jgi:hypothetical protein
MAVTFPSASTTSPPVADDAAPAPADASTTPATSDVPADPLASDKAYARNVAVAWLAGIVVMGTLVTVLTMLVGGLDDLGVGGSIAVGVFAGFWVAPIVGVIGIGRWASRWQQH